MGESFRRVCQLIALSGGPPVDGCGIFRSVRLASLALPLAPPPATISEAAVRALRNRRLFMTAWLCLALLYGAWIMVFAGGHLFAHPTVTHATVSKVYPPDTIEPSGHPYGIRANDGDYYYFSNDPQLSPGDPVTITRNSSGAFVSIAYRDQVVSCSCASTTTYGSLNRTIRWLGFGFLALLFLLTVAATAAVWIRERQVQADLRSPLATREVTINPIRIRHSWLTGTGTAFRPFFARPVRGRDVTTGEQVDLAVAWDDIPALNELSGGVGVPLRVSYHPHTGLLVEAETAYGRRLRFSVPAASGIGMGWLWRSQLLLLRYVRRLGPGSATWSAYRRYRLRLGLTALVMVPAFLLMVATIALAWGVLSPLPTAVHVADRTVRGVFDHDAGKPWTVRASDGLVYYFNTNPGLAPGDHFQVLRDQSGLYVGLRYDGHTELMRPAWPVLLAIDTFLAGLFVLLVIVWAFGLRKVVWMSRKVRADIGAEPERRRLKLADRLPEPVDLPSTGPADGGIGFRFKDEADQRAMYYVPIGEFRRAIEFLRNHEREALDVAYLPNTRAIVEVAVNGERLALGAT